MNTSGQGFQVSQDARNQRVVKISIDDGAIQSFLGKAYDREKNADLNNPFDLIPFEKMLLATFLEEILGPEFRLTCCSTLSDYELGAFSIAFPETVKSEKEMKMLQTAISYIVGQPRCDASGNHLARFVTDSSTTEDPLLLNPRFPIPLHADGAFYDGVTEWLMLLKVSEFGMDSGESTLCHIADWTKHDYFRSHEMGLHPFVMKGPGSNDTRRKTIGDRSDMGELRRPLFYEHDGHPAFRFTYQWVFPETFAEGKFLAAISDSLQEMSKVSIFPLPVGSLYCVNNTFWLHGRQKIDNENEEFSRVVTRTFGVL